MSELFVDITEESVAVATVTEGDEIWVSDRIEFRIVSCIETYEGDDSIRIVYFNRGENAWSKGWQHTNWLVERTIRPLRPDELVRVRRGDQDRADEVRLTMQYEREERWREKSADL